MDKRLTVDIPEDLHKSLRKVQFLYEVDRDNKMSMSELIKKALEKWVPEQLEELKTKNPAE